MVAVVSLDVQAREGGLVALVQDEQLAVGQHGVDEPAQQGGLVDDPGKLVHGWSAALAGDPVAEYVTPGHPLLDGTIDLIAERYDSLLRQGTVLIDADDPGMVPHMLVYLQHSVVDGRADEAGNRRVTSKRFEFVSVDPEGSAHAGGWAPYLDLRPATADEVRLVSSVIDGGWVRADLEDAAVGHGVGLARAHLEEVRRRTVDRVERTTAAVKARLESEIRYWDHRASQLMERELQARQ